MSGDPKQVSFLWALVGLVVGCSATPDSFVETEDVGSVEQEATLELTPQALSFKYLELEPPFPAGVAAGEKAIFVGDPLLGRVVSYSRQTGAPLGELPQPPTPFILPFMMKHIAKDKVAIMDAGGFPSPMPFFPANPTIYEYTYSVSGRALSATLTRSVPFTDALVGFAEDIVLLADGRYLLADAVLGSIWIANTDGSISPGIVPRTFTPEDAIPELYFCPTMPTVQVGGQPFLFTGATIPGISAIAERKGMVYFASACAGAVYKVPLASLTDSRQPWERADDIELLSPKPEGVEVEELLSMVFNPHNPSEKWVYAADAMQLRLIRIHTVTGERQVLGDDPELFNFPSSLAFMPPRTRHEVLPQLVVVSNQQHLTTITNDAIEEDQFQFPFIATRVMLKPRLY